MHRKWIDFSIFLDPNKNRVIAGGKGWQTAIFSLFTMPWLYIMIGQRFVYARGKLMLENQENLTELAGKKVIDWDPEEGLQNLTETIYRLRVEWDGAEEWSARF